jgi:hypothetical protein
VSGGQAAAGTASARVLARLRLPASTSGVNPVPDTSTEPCALSAQGGSLAAPVVRLVARRKRDSGVDRDHFRSERTVCQSYALRLRLAGRTLDRRRDVGLTHPRVECVDQGLQRLTEAFEALLT